MPLTAGSRLGSHEIISLLGTGGMGEVYLAHDTKLNRRVAIKVLPDSHAQDPERIARFHREAQAVAALNHSGIAAIYELAEATLGQVGQVGQDQLIRFIVLELVEGDTLADRVRRGALPVEEALAIATQILEALEAAHEKGICHRDLKPANIKLTPDGTVKVLDFGLAKFLQVNVSPANLTHSPTISLAATYPGVILGTAGYMSPEQAKGFEADQRSDIFSFGCVLYELLTGRRAFDGETVSEVLAGVLKSDVDSSALPARLNPRLVEVLRRCLEKNPKKRWHAAADVRVEIEALMGRGLVVDEPRTVEVRQRPLWKRAGALAAAALVGGAVAGYTAWRLKPEPPRSITKFAIPLAQGQQFTNVGRQIIAMSPDGTTLVYVANRTLHVHTMSGMGERVITSEDPAGMYYPAFSPDGKVLAYVSGSERALKRIDIGGGAAFTICSLDVGNILYGVSWGEQGILIGSDAGISRVSPSGGTPELVEPAAPGEVISNAEILPDGKTLLFSVSKGTNSWDTAEIVVRPLAGKERKTVVKGGADGRYLSTGHLVYAQSGVLLAVPFDLARLETTGSAVPAVEGVRRTNLQPSDGPPNAQFSYSSTGTLVYLPGPVSTSEAATDLALFDRKGAFQPLKLPPGGYTAPRVSPDGRRIAFERMQAAEASVWTYELAALRAPQRLTFGGNNRTPVWSHDGQWVAFQSDREGDTAIFRQRADGSVPAERMTKPETGSIHTPQSWSRDGEHLLFSVQTGDQARLWTLAVRDKTLTAYGEMEAREAVFSPDGQWVAYQSPNNVVRDTFIAPFPWTGSKYLVPHVGNGGGHPFWSAKGDEIIMNTGQSRGTIVSVTTRPSVSFGSPVDFPRAGRSDPNPAIGRRNSDMLPDNEHIVSVLAASTLESETPQINVVLNWFDEVRQKVPQ